MKNPVNVEKWGREAAKERYSAAPKSDDAVSRHGRGKAIIGLIDQPKLDETGRVMQAPQSVNDEHGPDYDNDTPHNWIRGMPNESAEGKPGFDKKKPK